MARKKKKNPYDDWGLQQSGASFDEDESENPYNDWGSQQATTTKERDPSIVWNWDEPSKAELARQVAEKEAQKEDERKKAEEKAKEKTGRGFWEKLGDKFEANSPEDKAKREARGEPSLYQDQKAAEKQESERLKNFDFSSEDVDARRDLYKRRGVDLDQFIADKQVYDAFKEESKGQPVSKLARENKIPEEAKRYERTQKEVRKVESNFQDALETESGKDNSLEQAERGFVRGAGESLAKLPRSLQVAGAAGLDLVSPEGSRADKLAERQYEAGKKGLQDVEQQIADTGYGTNEADNDFIANTSAGLGSLTGSLGVAGIAGTGAAAATFGVNAGAEQQIGAEEAGKSELQSFITGLGAGSLEAGLEKVGLDKFLGASGGAVKKFLVRAGTEGGQEALQSVSQSGVESTYTSVDVSDAVTQALIEGGYGALVGGGAGLAFSVAETLQAKGVPPEEAEMAGEIAANKAVQIADEELPVPGMEETPSGQPPVVAPIVDDATTTIPPVTEVPVEVAPTERPKGAMKPLDSKKQYDDLVKGAAALTDDQITAKLTELPPHHQAFVPASVSGGKALYGVEAIRFYNGKQKPAATEPKPAPAKPKGSLKPLGKTKTDVSLVYPETKDLPEGIKEYVPVDEEQLQKDGKQVPKATDKLTPTEASRLSGRDIGWRRQDLKQLVELVPGLKENPVLTARATSDGLMFDYKAENQSGSIPASKVGFSEERLQAAKVKNGTTIDIGSVLKSKGRLPAINRGGKNYDLMPNKTETKSMKREKYAGSKTPEDLKKLVNDLNKAGQKNAITRRGQLKSKKAAGMFTHGPARVGDTGKEAIKLQDKVILDPAHYVTTLAHELAHAIEWQVTGYTGKKTYEMLGAKTKEEQATIKAELKAIVDNLESTSVVEQDPHYYYKATEMWARYIETWIMENASARELAPNVTKAFESLIVTEQAVKDLYDAIEGNIDKSHKSYTPRPLKDRKQIYQHHLGKAAGTAAWDAEVVRRAEVQRSARMIEKLVKEKFKDVKDSGESLFRAAEAIKIVEGELDYGTTDYYDLDPSDTASVKAKVDAGFTLYQKTVNREGKEVHIYSKVRYTPEQAKEMLAALTPQGRKLIEEFNTAKKDAKDMFNRDLLKEIYNIDAKIEGWVHHVVPRKGRMVLGKKTGLKKQTAGSKKQRTGAGGVMEDFRKATEKAMVDLATAKINNGFVQRQMARLSKPIARGQKPDQGWTEVIYDEKYGMRLPGESRESMRIQQVVAPEEGFFGELMVISDKKFMKPVQKYQIPTELAEHYRNIRQIPEEMSNMVQTLDFIGKYWTVNVLTHPGTTSTNFISGGIQFSAKLFNDFYLDVLTGDYTMGQTRSNLVAPIVALTPRGWSKAPDWLWGGYRSTLHGQLASDSKDTRQGETRLDHYGNAVLKGFSMVEIYWKRVIALSEGANLSPEKISKEVRELDKAEKAMIAEVNKAIDLYAYDYDNKPLWMEKFDRKGGKLAKPFITYPYKYTKMLATMAAAPFDRSLTWQERMAKGLTLTTMMVLVTALVDDREEKQKTPEGTAETPYPLRPGGRLFAGVDDKGREMFIRTAKYPFFNASSVGRSLLKGHVDETTDIFREMYGTTGLGLDLALLAIGRKSEFDQYKPNSAIFGEKTATLMPGFRILGDVGKILDGQARSPKNFQQGIGVNLPIWGNEEVLAEWRGKPRELKVPDEPEEGRQLNKGTTSTRDVVYERSDILRSLMAGIYVSRIDPSEARRQQLRELRSAAESEINALLKVDPDSQEARDKAAKAGLTISDGTIRNYRSKLK